MAACDMRKATPGIMESWRARAPIGPARCFIAVGFPSPGRAVAAKGTGVHWLKGDISWEKAQGTSKKG